MHYTNIITIGSQKSTTLSSLESFVPPKQFNGIKSSYFLKSTQYGNNMVTQLEISNKSTQVSYLIKRHMQSNYSGIIQLFSSGLSVVSELSFRWKLIIYRLALFSLCLKIMNEENMLFNQLGFSLITLIHWKN